jgi:hypothetical protein
MVFNAEHVSSQTEDKRTCSKPKQKVGIASPTHSSEHIEG